MSEKTIALSGAETEVHFSGGNAWIRNDGAAVVYASKTAGITAGADGVISIPAGGSAPVYGAGGKVFLLGSGSVQLVGSDYATNPFKTSAQAGGSGADDVARAAIEAHAGNAEIHVTAEEKAAWNGKAELTDIPTSLPADGGNADTAETIGGKSSADLAYLTNVIGGLRRGYASTDIGTIMTYNDREVSKTTNDLTYFGWTINADRWFAPIVVSQYSSGTNYDMFGNKFGYGISQDSECASFAYKGRTYYACWSNGGAYQNPAVVGGLHLTLTNNDYISACKTLIDACEAIDAETVDGLHVSDFALKTDIPTSLPADGGNADTVGTKSATQILAVKNRFSNDMNDLKEQGSYIAIAATNAPSEAWGTVCVYAGGSGSVVQIYVTDTGSESEQSNTFIRHFNGTFWSPWRSVFDDGNATTLETHPASDFVLKSDYDALAARVAALEEAVIVSNGETTE